MELSLQDKILCSRTCRHGPNGKPTNHTRRDVPRRSDVLFFPRGGWLPRVYLTIGGSGVNPSDRLAAPNCRVVRDVNALTVLIRSNDAQSGSNNWCSWCSGVSYRQHDRHRKGLQSHRRMMPLSELCRIPANGLPCPTSLCHVKHHQPDSLIEIY